MNTPSTYFDGIDTTITSGSGGEKQEVGGYVVHEYTASGDFTPATTARYEFFMVGPGGAGGKSNNSTNGGGGGGGGEVVLGSVTLTSGSAYTVTIGTSNTVFGPITAAKGGNGGGYAEDGDGSAGSGGGAAGAPTIGYDGGTSTAANGVINYLYRYGNDGGDTPQPNQTRGAGGGGAGGIGGNPPDGATGGDGGAGFANNWLGSTTYYGGGGGGFPSGTGTGGGASAPSSTSANGNDGTANTGGGGSGSANGSLVGDGGTGIVLVRYKTSV